MVKENTLPRIIKKHVNGLKNLPNRIMPKHKSVWAKYMEKVLESLKIIMRPANGLRKVPHKIMRKPNFHLGYCMQKDGESPKTIIEHVSGMKKQRHREKLSLNLS